MIFRTSFRKQINAVSKVTALILFLFTSLPFIAQEQKKKVKYHHSDELLYDKELVDAQRLIGNVHLEYEGTHFYSDSAYWYASEDFDAFSNIRIQRGADYTVTGDLMTFNRKEKVAVLTNNARLRDREMTLTSDHLTYNTETEIANYFGGGKIVSNANKNVLTSEKGFYHGTTQNFFFRKDVVLKNPDYTVNCDTMQYNNATEITYFFGPTTIRGERTTIYCENGYYNTRTDQCRFGKNATVTSESTVLSGDSIYYDGRKKIGEVFRNVVIRDTTQSYIISGDYGKHLEMTKESFVTGRALMTQVFEDDSLFMHADTLKSIPDSLGRDVVFAFHHVKLFKTDLQGKCDSLVYAQTDSTLRMFSSPVLWSENNQVMGDSISIKTSDGELEALLVRGNAFIISDAEIQSDTSSASSKYNQVKGRRMTGHFSDNELNSVYAEGNGQLIYFLTDEKTGTARTMGLNKGECSNLNIEIHENQITRIRMEKDANSVFNPMRFVGENDFLLEGFIWREVERPTNKEEIFE
ncbi:MAG: OstA-like protein [Flavobacteriales bacterium]|nr:OstA-like protein [Flavobacteriales bacterium]